MFRPFCIPLFYYVGSVGCLPEQAERQTVLFSATMPGDVQAIASIAMRPTYEVVDCVGEEENTHQHVRQK